MTRGSERRRVQRIVFDSPLTASLSGLAAILIDISTVGAQVEHGFPLAAGRRLRLDFEAEGERLALHCEVARCRLQRSKVSATIVYSSGLRFVDAEESSREKVRNLVATLIARKRRPTSSSRQAAIA